MYKPFLEVFSEIERSLEHLAIDISRAINDFKANRQGVSHNIKIDGSPVTLLDHQLNALCLKALRSYGYTIISEESPLICLDSAQSFWLIDPLDGTIEFLEGTADYCVNIAFIVDNYPVFGWIYHPESETIYYTNLLKNEVQSKNLRTLHKASIGAPVINNNQSLIIGLSRRQKIEHDEWNSHNIIHIGAGVKYISLINGEIGLYPRVGPCGEWDTAAGQALLEYLGGFLVDSNKMRLRYNKPMFLNNGFYAGFDKRILK